MTADIEQLPCGVEHELRADAAIIRSWIDVANGPINREALADRLDRYANAAAELTAEIEALRAEVERLRADRDSWEQQASDRVADWHAEHLRAERLAEALALLPDEIVMVEHNPDEGPLMFCCGRKVKLSWLHDLIPTHNEGCWYARMRAMRDHDKENRND